MVVVVAGGLSVAYGPFLHSLTHHWLPLSLSLSSAMYLASYLVDPASSHMLVSKIKPCMSKYKLLQSETANGSLGHP